MRVERTSCALLASALLVAGCGYRSANAGASGERFAVVLTSSNIPDAVASDEVIAGVRDELARAGALVSGDVYPRCEVEVLRDDESSEGVSATRNGQGVLLPDARALRVGLVARAWIVRSRGGEHERDTGDVRAIEVVGVAADARAATFHESDALRAAGRRAGRRIGLRVLGIPTGSD